MTPIPIDSEIQSPNCPTNGRPGSLVNVKTLKGMLAISLIELRPPVYRFCPDPNCPTVYYSEDGVQSFDEDALREKVYQKHPYDKHVLVCYCFRYTLGSIRTDNGANRSATIPAAITKGVREGKCACDIRNPQGNCCLGNVKSLIKETRSLNPFQ
jgi:hypothetical protein